MENTKKPLNKCKLVFCGDTRNNVAYCLMYICAKLGIHYVEMQSGFSVAFITSPVTLFFSHVFTCSTGAAPRRDGLRPARCGR